MEENQYFRPFGPSIAKFKMPDNIIKILNNHADEIINDNDKAKNLDHGKRLAGNVKQEFKLEPEFLKSSGFLNFLAFLEGFLIFFILFNFFFFLLATNTSKFVIFYPCYK